MADVKLAVKPLFAHPIQEVRVKRPMRLVQEPQQDPALLGVYALIEGLRAGEVAIHRERREQALLKREGRATRRMMLRHKLLAFVLFCLMSALLLGLLWAGAHG